MATKGKVKESMLLHSEAKVEFYKKYLECYLRILYLSNFIDKIYLFDVFCGTGIYDNGKKGSPIVAFEEIKKLRNNYPEKKTEINLVINDQDPTKIGKVLGYIGHKNNYCKIHSRNRDVTDLFPDLIRFFNGQKKSERNLIFIDPYGYKNIRRNIIEELLANGRTEIILFLPISQMQRFTMKAVESEELMYSHLKQFIFSFFPDKHPIKLKTIPALKYIEYIAEALKFNKYYSTSYYIERDSKNYYALFFLSSNIFGFQKILEVKWSLDKQQGRGYQLPKDEILFKEEFEEQQKQKNYEDLKVLLLKHLNTGSKNNVELYSFILENEFLPSHLSKLINNLIKENKIEAYNFLNKLNTVKADMFSHINFKNNSEICTIKLI